MSPDRTPAVRRGRGGRLPGAGVLVAILPVVLAAGCALPPPFRTSEADLVRGRFASGTAGAGPTGRLVAVSWNIRFGENVDVTLRELRRDPRAARPDVLLLQEMDPAGVERIARELGLDFAYFPASIHPHHGRFFGNAVLARGRIGRAWFVELPTPGPLCGTERIAVVAEVDMGGRPMTVVSMHASTMIVPQPIRTEQFRTLAASLLEIPGPVLVGGDFNTVTNDDTLRAFRELRRTGLRRVAIDESTIPPKGDCFLRHIGTLDGFFHRGLAATGGGVVVGTTASDHYPVWAEFAWEAP